MNASIPFPRRRLIHARDLLRELVVRDIKLRYQRSVIGVAWSLVNPLAQVLVLSFIFRLVLPIGVEDYSSFVFAGVLVWAWYSTSLHLATGAITENRELVRRPGFPTTLLPVVTVGTSLVQFLLALPVLFGFLLIDRALPTAAYLALPLLIAVQFLVILSPAYLLAAVHVTFRDTQHLLGLALLVMFYLTPIFYEVSVVPERFRLIYQVNPMTWLLDGYRAVLLRGEWPNFAALGLVATCAAALLWLGLTLFRRASHTFVEEL